MTPPDDQSLRLHELAALPPTDPGRAELQSRLAAMDAPQREYWLAVIAQTDHLYAQLPAVDIPASLHSRLLAIPTARARPSWRSRLNQPVGPMHIAAVALIAIAAASWFFWPSTPHRPDPLNPAVASHIAAMAVTHHQSSTLDITSADRQKVTAFLQSRALPFTPSIPAASPKAMLLGGGSTSFDNTPVAFTRWQEDTFTYTLYQFAGKSLNVPAIFQATNAAPPASPFHALIWAGADGQGDFALTFQSDSAPNIFAGCQ